MPSAGGAQADVPCGRISAFPDGLKKLGVRPERCLSRSGRIFVMENILNFRMLHCVRASGVQDSGFRP